MAINTNIDPYWDDYNQATAVDGGGRDGRAPR